MTDKIVSLEDALIMAMDLKGKNFGIGIKEGVACYRKPHSKPSFWFTKNYQQLCENIKSQGKDVLKEGVPNSIPIEKWKRKNIFNLWKKISAQYSVNYDPETLGEFALKHLVSEEVAKGYSFFISNLVTKYDCNRGSLFYRTAGRSFLSRFSIDCGNLDEFPPQSDFSSFYEFLVSDPKEKEVEAIYLQPLTYFLETTRHNFTSISERGEYTRVGSGLFPELHSFRKSQESTNQEKSKGTSDRDFKMERIARQALDNVYWLEYPKKLSRLSKRGLKYGLKEGLFTKEDLDKAEKSNGTWQMNRGYQWGGWW